LGVQQVLVLALLEHDKAVAEKKMDHSALGAGGEMNLRHVSLTTASSTHQSRRSSEHHGSGSHHGEQGKFKHE
jgi:hypothetical protein